MQILVTFSSYIDNYKDENKTILEIKCWKHTYSQACNKRKKAARTNWSLFGHLLKVKNPRTFLCKINGCQ